MRNRAALRFFCVACAVGGMLLVWAAASHQSANRALGGTRMAAGCVSAADAAQAECALQLENAWYDGGSVEYRRADRIKDGPRCQRVREATYEACKGRD